MYVFILIKRNNYNKKRNQAKKAKILQKKGSIKKLLKT